jgi:hypothetical protein
VQFHWDRDQLHNTAYEPAKQLRLAGAMDEAMQALRSGQAIAPYSRHSLAGCLARLR